MKKASPWTYLLLLGVAYLFLLGSVLSQQTLGQNTRPVPENLAVIAAEADMQVQNSFNAVLQTAQGQAWQSAINYRTARYTFIMAEMGLKPSEGWEAVKDEKTGKLIGFRQNKPPVPNPKP